MRLYLSSFRVGSAPDRLVELVRRGGAGTVGVVGNALDEAEADHRAGGVELERGALAGLGLKTAEVDLRDYRASTGTLAAELARLGGLWVRGGNSFVLRHAMAVSGADEVLPRLIRDDALAYGGYSAGCCVLAPSLHGLEAVDDADSVRRLYGADARYEGLGILDRPFVPHLDSPGHPETELVGEVAASYRAGGVAFWGLRDGQVLVVDGPLAQARLLG